MKSALLFPGHGSQHAGMLDFVSQDKLLTPLVDDLHSVLGLTVDQLQTPESLQRTRPTQLALFVAGVASFQQLQAAGATIDFVAGFSIGAFSAAVASGAYTFRDLLPVVDLRGAEMERAYPQGYGMLAIACPAPKQLTQVVATDPNFLGRVYLASINSARQIVFAGECAALDQVARLAREFGATAVQHLNVAAPSHCPLLRHVAQKLHRALDGLPLRPPQLPYLSNVTTHLVRDAESIRNDLAENVAKPINWYRGMELLLETDVEVFVEALPSDILTRLGRQHSDHAQVRRISISAQGLSSSASLLRRPVH